MQSSPFLCHLVPLSPKYYPQRPILKQSSLRFSLNLSNQVSHRYKKQAKLQFCVSKSLYFWIANWKTRDSAQKIVRINRQPSGHGEITSFVPIVKYCTEVKI